MVFRTDTLLGRMLLRLCIHAPVIIYRVRVSKNCTTWASVALDRAEARKWCANVGYALAYLIVAILWAGELMR